MEIKLNDTEMQLLLEILEEQHRDLVMEIAHTDHHEFKMMLRGKEKLLAALLDKIAQPVCV